MSHKYVIKFLEEELRALCNFFPLSPTHTSFTIMHRGVFWSSVLWKNGHFYCRLNYYTIKL